MTTADIVSPTLAPSCLSIITVNIQSLLSKPRSTGDTAVVHKAELEARLSILNPHIVCVQETWLDASVVDLSFHG